ncbi:phage integrase central domain-containing protein [Salipiger mucosus]
MREEDAAQRYENARRVRGAASCVLRCGIATGDCDRDVAADL